MTRTIGVDLARGEDQSALVVIKDGVVREIVTGEKRVERRLAYERLRAAVFGSR